MAIREKFIYAIDIVTDGVETGFKRISRDIKDAEGSIGKFKAGWKGAVDEFKNSRAAQAAAVGAISAAAVKAVNDASDLEESINAVTVTFGDAADAVLKIGENSAEAFGLSKAEFNSLAVSFSSFAETVAGPGGDVAGTLEDLTQRAADFASVMNIDVADAARVFQSGLAGEAEPLKRFGINLQQTAVGAHAVAVGISDSATSMTEAEKVAARYSLLMKETSDTHGDFANTSESLANQQRVLQATMTDLSAEVGTVLIPHLSELTGGLLDVANAAKQIPVVPEAFKSWQDNLNVLGTGPKEMDIGLKSLAEKFNLIDTEAEKAHKAIDQTATAAGRAHGAHRELAEVTEEEAKQSAALGASLGTLDSELKAIHGASKKAAEGLDDVGDDADKAARRVEALESAFADLNDEMSDRSAWLDVEDAIDRYATATETAKAAQAEFGQGSRESASANRDAERAMQNRIRAVIDYVSEVQGIPPETVSEVRAMIDRGSIEEAEAALARLERTRQTQVNITTYYRTVGSSSAPTQTRVNGPRAKGGPTFPGLHEVIEDGPELLEQGGKTYLMSEGGGNVVPLGGAGSAGTGSGANYTVNVTAGMGANGPEISRIIVDEIRKFERRNGPGWRQ